PAPCAGGVLVRLRRGPPAAAGRWGGRLCGLFFGEGAVGPNAVRALADDLRAHRLDVGRAVATVLRSRAFFAAANLGTRIVGPVEGVVAAARALELADPPPSTLALADWAARLGQDLFYPPNVGGWPGGRAWITTRAAVGRANFAASLVAGPGVGRPEPFDAAGLAKKYGRTGDELPAFCGELVRG